MIIYRLPKIRDRAYVIDLKGNKIFYGTEYQCKKFIAYMKDEPNLYKKSKNILSNIYGICVTDSNQKKEVGKNE